jgi:hypothetical protein
MRALLGTVLHEIVQLLDSADRPDERIGRLLDLLRQIVPYEQSPLFQACPGPDPRLLAPATSSGMRAVLGTARQSP